MTHSERVHAKERKEGSDGGRIVRSSVKRTNHCRVFVEVAGRSTRALSHWRDFYRVVHLVVDYILLTRSLVLHFSMRRQYCGIILILMSTK